MRDPVTLYEHPLQMKMLTSFIQVIYIDQPIGTGFSYGTDTVNSTASAAPFVWEAFQILFESGQFSKFQSREYVRSIAFFFLIPISTIQVHLLTELAYYQVYFCYRKLRRSFWTELRYIFRRTEFQD